METTFRRTTIATGDGNCRATFHYPMQTGRWPGVVLVMDGLGIRPALDQMAARLAGLGYGVLLPDLFYRVGAYQPVDVRDLLADSDRRQAWFAKYAASVTQAAFLRDMASFVPFVDRQQEVDPLRKLAAVGYCLGGGLAIAAGGAFPTRIGLVASFHGGNLATDDADSPHRMAAKIKAFVYVAGASDDSSFPDAMKVRLDAALTVAAVPHKIETYDGAKHGWVPADMPAHDRDAAERHWAMLESLLSAKL